MADDNTYAEGDLWICSSCDKQASFQCREHFVADLKDAREVIKECIESMKACGKHPMLVHGLELKMRGIK